MCERWSMHSEWGDSVSMPMDSQEWCRSSLSDARLGHSWNPEVPKEKGAEMSEKGCWEMEDCGAERGWERTEDGDGSVDGEDNQRWRLLHIVPCVWC